MLSPGIQSEMSEGKCAGAMIIWKASTSIPTGSSKKDSVQGPFTCKCPELLLFHDFGFGGFWGGLLVWVGGFGFFRGFLGVWFFLISILNITTSKFW